MAAAEHVTDHDGYRAVTVVVGRRRRLAIINRRRAMSSAYGCAGAARV